MSEVTGHTAWILAEHLTHENPVLNGAARVLIVESEAALTRGRVHRQKLHLTLVAMRSFAHELRARGVLVDVRRAPSFTVGVAEHRRENGGCEVRVLKPTGPEARERATAMRGVRIIPGSLFLTSDAQFDAWAADRKTLVMEGFYRSQRQRLGVLMNGNVPEGGTWNFDKENRGMPPAGTRPPAAWTPTEGEIDRQVRHELDAREISFGSDGPRGFPATAAEASAALADFVEHRLPHFGRWQDAMLQGQRVLWHSGLAVAMNLGLLDPMDAVRAAEAAYREGSAPIASAEGFVRQIIGWREYVRALFARREDDWTGMNALGADRPLPALFWGGPTEMRCMSDAIGGLQETAYSHHIERLMLFGNLQLLLGVRPDEALAWFQETHIDGHAWVMAPNVLGMALHADGGRMMTKPYAASGAYVNRMSDHCTGCRYTPSRREGPDACPLTTLYWDFLARHQERFATNHRMTLTLRNLNRIPPPELAAIRAQAKHLRADFQA